MSDATERVELRRAVRALLAAPLLDRSSPEELALVRRHRTTLTRWFADELGYRLDATRPGVARLAKLPGPGHVARGMLTRAGRPFDGARYALTCLVLAAVEAAGERCTLASLFDDVTARAATIDGLAFDPEQAADRRRFIQAVQGAVELRVLERAEGDEERFARGDRSGDALYRVDRERLALLPTAPQPPSLAGSPEAVAAEPYPDTDEGRTRRRRHRVARGLVDQPVLYLSDLDNDDREYLRTQRARFERLLRADCGLDLEVRAEGLVTVDTDGELTDLRFPDYGATPTTALRLCDELRRRRGAGAADAWPWPDVVEFVRGLAAEYAGYWKQGATDDAGASQLAESAVALLVRLRLAERGDAGTGPLVALPAAARFATRPAASTSIDDEPTDDEPADDRPADHRPLGPGDPGDAPGQGVLV